MTEITAIRTNAAGQPYLTEPPAIGFVHIAYQDFDADDLDGTQNSLWATEERHMVNGINQLYGTSFNWGDLEGMDIEFFNPKSQTTPFVKFRFSKLGEYYVATIIKDSTMDIDSVKSITEIGEMLSAGRATKDKVYYATKEHRKDLVRFLNAHFSTHRMRVDPSRDIDFTQMVLGENNHLVTVILRNFKGQNGVSTLTFKNEVIDVAPIELGYGTRQDIVAAFNHLYLDTPITQDNLIGSKTIRTYEPMIGVEQTYTIYEITQGENTKHVISPPPFQNDAGD